MSIVIAEIATSAPDIVDTNITRIWPIIGLDADAGPKGQSHPVST